MDTHELAWAAGFFDGEGCFSSAHEKAVKRPRTLLAVGQTETSSLYRLQRAFGFGSVYGPYSAKGRRKDNYQFIVRDFEHVQAALAMMWRWLGGPKRAQAATVFRNVREYLDGRNAVRDERLRVCSNGHQKDPEGKLYVGKSYGLTRRCGDCDREAHARYEKNHPGVHAKNRKARRERLRLVKGVQA